MYDNDIVPQEHIDVELTIGSILTSTMTAPAKLLCIAVRNRAGDGWAPLTYEDIGPIISRSSDDAITGAINNAEETGFLLVEREPDKFKQITRFVANRYHVVTDCPSPVSAQRMSPEIGVGNDQTEFAQVTPSPEIGVGNDLSDIPSVFPQVSPSPETGDTITSNSYRYPSSKDQNQDQNLAPDSLREYGDESQDPIVVPDPLRGHGDQKKYDVTQNPFTRPEQTTIWCQDCDTDHADCHVTDGHLWVCHGCGGDSAQSHCFETKRINWCETCNPDYFSRYVKAVRLHRDWEQWDTWMREQVMEQIKNSAAYRESLGLTG